MALSVFFGTVVLGWVNINMAKEISQQETQVKYLEISVEILSNDPRTQHVGLRDWAIRQINRYSDEKLDKETQQQLRSNSIQDLKLRTRVSPIFSQERPEPANGPSANRNTVKESAAPSPPNAPNSRRSEIAPMSGHSLSYAVEIPAEINSVYLFFQSRSNQTASGCDTRLQGVTPDEFISKVGPLIDQAKRNPDLAVIVTAFSDRLRWAAPVDIRINGQRLSEESSYWCNGQRFGGWEYR
jgi:hypothetical protein